MGSTIGKTLSILFLKLQVIIGNYPLKVLKHLKKRFLNLKSFLILKCFFPYSGHTYVQEKKKKNHFVKFIQLHICISWAYGNPSIVWKVKHKWVNFACWLQYEIYPPHHASLMGLYNIYRHHHKKIFEHSYVYGAWPLPIVSA